MKRSTSDTTTLTLIGALAAARSIRWLSTPLRHSRAGIGAYTVTWVSLAVGLALIGYAFYMRRRERDGSLTD